MQFNGKTYAVLKALALIWLPAAGALYLLLGGIWHLPYTEQVNASVLGVDTFLGVVLGISTKSYNKSDAKYDGVFAVEYGDEGEQKLRLRSVDYDALNTKNELLFKLDDKGAPSPAPAAQ